MAESEIELKLSLAETEVSRFRRDTALHRMKRARAVSRSLLAVYFDTPGLSLRAHKAALRIRQEGTDRIQTLKVSGKGAGLQHRTEYNAPTTAQEPELSLIDDPAMRQALVEMIGDEPLVPVFTTDVRRTLWLLDLPGGPVELALDLGQIESQGRVEPICEVELELKGGTPQDLLDVADDLGARFGMSVAIESKAQRGYALFKRTEPTVQKANKLKLNPQQPAWDAVTGIIEEGTAQLLGNEAAVLAGTDIEGVHQARVAVRRLRAALSAFRDSIPDDLRKPLNKALRRHQLALGPARDWDVFLTETLAPLESEHRNKKSFKAFQARVQIARKRAYKKAHKALRSARYDQLKMALIRFPYQPEPQQARHISTGAVAKELLDQRLSAVLAAAGPDPKQLDDVALHALRIDVKKLRYAIDFFVSLYDPQALKPWKGASKALQECLGGLNDAVVHAALLDAMEAPDMPVPKSIRRAIENGNTAKIEAGKAEFDARWAEFKALTPFWT